MDCFSKHAKFFSKPEMNAIMAAIRANVESGMPQDEANRAAVQTKLDEARADLNEITEAVKAALPKAPQDATAAALQSTAEAMKEMAAAVRDAIAPKPAAEVAAPAEAKDTPDSGAQFSRGGNIGGVSTQSVIGHRFSAPVEFRITNGYSHAEIFRAATFSEFRKQLNDALNRFTQWNLENKGGSPIYQELRYHLHISDPSGLFAHDKNRWVHVKKDGVFPAITTSSLFSGGAERAWSAALTTADHTLKLKMFLSHDIPDLLKEEGLPEKKKRPTLYIIKSEDTQPPGPPSEGLGASDSQFSRPPQSNRDQSPIPAGFTIDEANREKTQALEKFIKDTQGYDFTITPLARPGRALEGSSTGESSVHLRESGAVEYGLAERLAEIFGKKVMWVAGDGDFSFGGVTALSKELSPYIFLDPRSKNPAHILVGHELTHHMAAEAPAVYKKLFLAIHGLLRNYPEYRVARNLPGGMGEIAAKAEMIGDLMGDNFDKPEFWTAVAKESGGAFRQIANTVKAWLDKLVWLITGKKGFESEQFVSDVHAARKALAQALAEYAGSQKNVSRADQTQTADGRDNIDSVKQLYEVTPEPYVANGHTYRKLPVEAIERVGVSDKEKFSNPTFEFLPGGHLRFTWSGYGVAHEFTDVLRDGVHDHFVKTEPSVYWRFTNNKAETTLANSGQLRPSLNHRDNFRERGVSVSQAPGYGHWGYKYGYKVTGEEIGVGTDGEPILNPNSIKAVSKIQTIDEIDAVEIPKRKAALDAALKAAGWSAEQYRASQEAPYLVPTDRFANDPNVNKIDTQPPGPPSEGLGASGPTNPDIRFSRESIPQRIATTRQANYKSVATSIVDRVDQALNPLGTLPDQQKYLAQRGLAQGLIEKADEAAIGIRRAFPTANDSDKQAIFDYLTTAGATSDGIRNSVHRREAEQIKAQIGKIGDQLVEHGMLSEESRDRYKDAYLPRLYLKHLLTEGDWKALGAGKKPSTMGYLKRRRDIPDEIRKVILGEVTDPGFLAAVAIAKPARDMALLDWLGQIANNQNWILPSSLVKFTSTITGKTTRSTPFWLKEEAAQLRKQARYYQPENAAKAEAEARAMDNVADDALEGMQGEHREFKQIPNTARYGRLRGIFVRQEIYNDLMGVNDFLPTDPGWFQNVFGYGGTGTKATQIWKAMKVSMNPPAQVRNFISNMVLMQLGGVPLHMLPSRFFEAVHQIRHGGKHFQIAKKYGVGLSTFATQEVYRMKTELLDLEMKARGLGPLGRMHRIAALLMNKSSDFYQLSETIGKTMMIIDGMERQGMSEEDAVAYGQKWLFDYSLVQKSARYARSAPIGVPFLTFSLKVLPRLIEAAALHPQRFIPWVTLFYGMPMLVASMLGVDNDDLDKLKKALPEWLRDKGHAMILPYKDDQGRWQVVDLGYFVPWTTWTQLAGDVASGEVGKAIKDTGIFGGPIVDIITAIKTGKDAFTGRDIFNKGDPPERQLASLINYMWNMAAPPFLTDHGLVSPMGLMDEAMGGKMVQALTGTTNKFGEPRSTVTQAALYMAGINVQAITPEYTRAQNIQKMTRDLQDVKSEMRQKLVDRSLSPERRHEIAVEYTNELLRRMTRFQQYVRDSAVAPALATR